MDDDTEIKEEDETEAGNEKDDKDIDIAAVESKPAASKTEEVKADGIKREEEGMPNQDTGDKTLKVETSQDSQVNTGALPSDQAKAGVEEFKIDPSVTLDSKEEDKKVAEASSVEPSFSVEGLSSAQTVHAEDQVTPVLEDVQKQQTSSQTEAAADGHSKPSEGAGVAPDAAQEGYTLIDGTPFPLDMFDDAPQVTKSSSEEIQAAESLPQSVSVSKVEEVVPTAVHTGGEKVADGGTSGEIIEQMQTKDREIIQNATEQQSQGEQQQNGSLEQASQVEKQADLKADKEGNLDQRMQQPQEKQQETKLEQTDEQIQQQTQQKTAEHGTSANQGQQTTGQGDVSGQQTQHGGVLENVLVPKEEQGSHKMDLSSSGQGDVKMEDSRKGLKEEIPNGGPRSTSQPDTKADAEKNAGKQREESEEMEGRTGNQQEKIVQAATDTQGQVTGQQQQHVHVGSQPPSTQSQGTPLPGMQQPPSTSHGTQSQSTQNQDTQQQSVQQPPRAQSQQPSTTQGQGAQQTDKQTQHTAQETQQQGVQQPTATQGQQHPTIQGQASRQHNVQQPSTQGQQPPNVQGQTVQQPNVQQPPSTQSQQPQSDQNLRTQQQGVQQPPSAQDRGTPHNVQQPLGTQSQGTQQGQGQQQPIDQGQGIQQQGMPGPPRTQGAQHDDIKQPLGPQGTDMKQPGIQPLTSTQSQATQKPLVQQPRGTHGTKQSIQQQAQDDVKKASVTHAPLVNSHATAKRRVVDGAAKTDAGNVKQPTDKMAEVDKNQPGEK